MERHDDGGRPDGSLSAGHSTAPQHSDTGDEEAASLSVNRKNKHKAS